MAVTVTTSGYTQINLMENYADWTGYVPADVTDFYKQGTQCVGFTMDDSGNNDTYDSGSWDLSASPCHVRFWFMTSSLNELNTDANGGIQVYLSDGSNTGYWYAGGSTTYPGGWFPVVVDVSQGVDSGTKPTNMNSITTFGIRINLTSTPKKTQNVWIDHICALEGLICYGDDSGGYFDFSHIKSAVDNTSNGWPIMRSASGIYFFCGGLIVGDASGSNGCKFQATSQRVIFEDRPVSTDAYAIEVVDNGTGTTEFILGDKSGTAAIQGCLLSVEDTSQAAKFTIDANTDTDVDNFKMYASTFYGAGTIKFANGAVNTEVLSCSFEQCAQVEPDDCDTEGCFFINTADADAALLWNDSISITDCGFFANTTGAGIEMPSAAGSPYDYDALMFSGNTYDVLNSSGSAISISKSSGSNPTNYEGSAVTFTTAAVTVSATITDADGTEIENALVYLQADAKSSGTATTDTTDKLVDSNATFQTDGVAIGDTAFNQDDGTAALVTAVDSETSLSLDSDNFPDGNEDYRVGGPLPDQDPVTISNSGTTATVTHTGHGMLNNDYVYIEGGDIVANEGVFQITYISANSYSYTMASSPGSSPTGTITSTFVGLFGLTNSSGVKSATARVYSSDQLLTGWARKSTSSPYYKEAPLRGTVSSSAGLSATGVLTSDE